jgi:hypothetical protein
VAAGSVADQLASEYAAQPVVFLEQNANSPIGGRMDRFWAAHGGGSAGYPMVMVDSGHQWTDRLVTSDFYHTYKNMVNTELARPAMAEIDAQYTRVNNHFSIDVMVKNISGVSLSSSNGANVVAIVYEDKHVGVTSRYVRAVAQQSITSLANNSTSIYTLTTGDLSGVDWNKLHIIALAEYRPNTSSYVYDTLNAAVAAQVVPLTVQPDPLSFLVDSANPADQTQALTISGGELGLSWSISSKPTWMTISPTSGTIGTPATAKALASSIPAGLQTGSVIIHFSGPLGSYDRSLTAKTYRGAVVKLYLPGIQR